MSLNRLKYFLGRFPVKVQRGLAHGAWWSIYPSSAYWRLGGNDPDVETALTRHAAHKNYICWDIGAHHGIYAVGLARAVGPDGRVEAFEPDPVSAGRLRWHKRLNRLSHLHIHEVAASEKSGEARIYQYNGFGATTSHLPFAGETLAHVPSAPIKIIRLDDWLREGRIRPPNFIKIDVEGHGVAALSGMKETLQNHRPIVLLAVHTAEERDRGSALLQELGYQLEPVSPATGIEIKERAFGELICLPQDS